MRSLNPHDPHNSHDTDKTRPPGARSIRLRRVGPAVAASLLALATAALVWRGGWQQGWQTGWQDGFEGGWQRGRAEGRTDGLREAAALRGAPPLAPGAYVSLDDPDTLNRTPAGRATALWRLGEAALAAGDRAAADHIYRGGLAIAEEAGLGVWRGRFLAGLAQMSLDLGDLAGARELAAAAEAALLGASDASDDPKLREFGLAAARHVSEEVARREGGPKGSTGQNGAR